MDTVDLTILCGHCGSDYLYYIDVCFLSQILIERKYIVSIVVIFPIFETGPYMSLSFLNL